MEQIQIAALILIVAGAAIPAMCIIKMHMIKNFKKNAVITKAIINNTEKRFGLKGSVYYLLFIQYKDNAGNIFYGQSIGTKKNIAGTTISIMYKTTNPANFKTDFGKYLPWLLGFSLAFFGLLVWFAYWLLHQHYIVRPQ
jgi:hypothetical protein